MWLAKIIHIITKLELGGAQLNTLYTITHLDKKKFLPYLISGETAILDEEAKKCGVPFYKVPLMVRPVMPHKDILALWQLIRLLRKIKKEDPQLPLIVHTHSSKAGILGRWAGFFAGCDGIVHSYHGFGFTDWQSPIVRNAFVWAERLTRPITDRFICVSINNLKKGAQKRVLVESKSHLIRSGISISEFKRNDKNPQEVKDELGIPADAPVVGMVACFKPQKAPLDFVDIAQRVASKHGHVYFLVAGDGELRAEMERKIEEYGLKDRFLLLGWRKDIPRLMSVMNVLVLTSLWEGLPRIIPQAWSSEVPLVVTAVDGSAEAIKNGINGFLFEPRDVETAAQKILALLEDRELAKSIALEGGKSVKEFDIDLMVQKQEELYLSLLLEKSKLK